jgi:uncharacterized protein
MRFRDKTGPLFIRFSKPPDLPDFFAAARIGAKVERVIVNELKSSTYFGRLVLSAENESQEKQIIEIDVRPSDCIAMATQQRAPIYVSLDVWDEVEDMTEVLRTMREEDSRAKESDQEEDS